MADTPRRTNEKPLKLPDDFEQTMKDLLAAGPHPKDGAASQSATKKADDDGQNRKLS